MGMGGGGGGKKRFQTHDFQFVAPLPVINDRSLTFTNEGLG